MPSRENRAVDPFDIPNEPELEDLLRMLARAIKLSIRTHATATVVTYNPATQKAVIQVGSLPVVKVTDPTKLPTRLLALKGVPPNATAILQPLQLANIPVYWPRTAAGYQTFPLTVGDTGELHIQDRSLETWLLLGIATDPVLAFTHALKDSIFHPGLHPDTAPIVPPTDLTATVLDGTAAIKIGAAAVSAIAKATELVALVDAAVTAAIAAGTGTPGSGAAAFTAFQSTWNASKAGVSALKGKVE